MCDINRKSLNKPPYDNDRYGKYNNIKNWMSKKYKGIYGENIYNDDIFTPLLTPLHYDNNKYYGKLIISDKGDSDLLNFFNEINSDDFFKYCLREIISIGKGIKILQDNGFIHNDIKASNCIKHNNTFKLIDLAQSKNIKNTIENINCNCYVYWPHTVVYTHFFTPFLI
jgi:tRNA A-37 threonylcarbamoyl transferase component Bud32